jgi:Ion transport protein
MEDFGEIQTSKKYNRGNKKKCMIYPEDQNKGKWDLFITFLLMITCVLTPYELAFENDDENFIYLGVDTSINICFAFDIVINFMTAYYDNDYNMIDDHRVIARDYIYTWFFIDLVSIIPFDMIFVFGNFNRLARVARIGKLYKIIRMTRMVRMLKIVKERNKLVKYLNEILKIGVGFERLMFMMLIFMVLQHVAACIWVFVARFDPTNKDNWIY